MFPTYNMIFFIKKNICILEKLILLNLIPNQIE